jgi:hypothetical protein
MIDEEQRGQNAQALLDDPLLQKALNATRAVIVEEWADTREEKGREYLWMLHRASLKFEEILFGWIQNGEIAKANLRPDKTFREKLKFM